MIDQQILFGGRGSGKTYKIMTEIHELIKSGFRQDILLVFPAMNYLHWWQREWERRFPHVGMVNYTSLANMDRVRGRYVKFAFVEDIHEEQDGIYSKRLAWLFPAMVPGSVITYTCGWTSLSDRSHSVMKSAAQVRRETYLKMQAEARRKRENEDAWMVAYMLTKSLQG